MFASRIWSLSSFILLATIAARYVEGRRYVCCSIKSFSECAFKSVDTNFLVSASFIKSLSHKFLQNMHPAAAEFVVIKV